MIKNMTTRITMISLAIVVLSLIAAGVGVFWQDGGSSYEFTTLRGETVLIHGRGLYRYDSVSMAAQAVAQDMVTLLIGIPFLLVSLYYLRRDSLRGKLLFCGITGYFLYTYMSYAVGANYNNMFLIYVAVFSLSLTALIIAVPSIDLSTLKTQFSEHMPKRSVVSYLLCISFLLFMVWMGRIVPAMISCTAPAGLESSTTLFIQFMDLGIVIPLSVVAGILLLRNQPLGYLLSSIMIIKTSTLALSVSAMAFNMLLSGADVAPAELIMFPAIAVSGIILMIMMLRSVSETAKQTLRSDDSKNN